MQAIIAHTSRCFIAGVVALLPVGSLVLTIVYLERTVSAAWPKDVFYFPGLGLLAAAVLLYLIGLTVTTFIGRWFWRFVDWALDRLPALGTLYRTLKQILGYGEGEEALFRQVVLVPSRDANAHEVGFVTNRVADGTGPEKLLVFVPGAPNPTAGRLLVIDASLVQPLAVPVNEALKALVSVGKTPIPVTASRSV